MLSTRCATSRSPPAAPACTTRCPRSRRPASARSRACRCRSASCSSRCCATATARRSPTSTCRQLANWAPTATRTDEIPVRRRPRRAAGLHRRAAARRSRRDAQRRAGHGQEPEDDRAAGAGRSRRRPLGDDRLLPAARRARPQHEARVQAQRRALRVHEVGDAGVRHLQGRAARHRHRPPGEPRVPRARRAREGRRATTPTRSSAPTATRR